MLVPLVSLGIVGTESGHDVAGITVHQAARIQALASGSEVLVSAAVGNLIGGSGITLQARGTHTLRGIVEPCALYRVDRVSAADTDR